LSADKVKYLGSITGGIDIRLEFKSRVYLDAVFHLLPRLRQAVLIRPPTLLADIVGNLIFAKGVYGRNPFAVKEAVNPEFAAFTGGDF